MKRLAWMCLFISALTSAATAQSVSVAYVEGEVLAGRGAGWSAVSVGDTLAADARVRLPADGYLELQEGTSRAGARIILSEAGTYSVSRLVSSRRAMDAAKVGPSLSSTLVRLVKGTTLKQSAVMGVMGRRGPSAADEDRRLRAARIADAQRQAEVEGSRMGPVERADAGPEAPPAASALPTESGAQSAAPPSAPPAEGTENAAPSGADETQIHLAAGKASLSAGDLDRAAEELMAALGTASAREMPEVRYYLACARSMSGDTRGALKLVEGLAVPQSADWAADYAIFRAKLLADASAWREVLSWLLPFAPQLSRDEERAPAYYFLLALGYQGTGRAEKGRENLRKVVSLAPDSELGAAAARLLGSK